MTTEAFAEIVSLVEAARGIQLSEPERQVWFGLLAPLDDADARQAAVQALREVEGRLTPAHIWNRAQTIRRDRRLPALPSLPEPTRPEVAEAWLDTIRERFRGH